MAQLTFLKMLELLWVFLVHSCVVVMIRFVIKHSSHIRNQKNWECVFYFSTDLFLTLKKTHHLYMFDPKSSKNPFIRMNVARLVQQALPLLPFV